MRFVLSPRARRDLEEILNYTVARWGPRQAEACIRSMQTAVETVAENPLRGRACDEIPPGYFKFTVGLHILFYRVKDDAVDIVRILHARMDVDSNL